MFIGTYKYHHCILFTISADMKEVQQMMCVEIVVPLSLVGSYLLTLMGIHRLDVVIGSSFVASLLHSFSDHPEKV